MKIGVLLLNFGEPEQPTLAEVVPFLERIFLLNADLEGHAAERARQRARQLAEARAPGLIEEYEEIGGSPLHPQAREQADRLEAELRRRGHDAVVLLGMQFTEPSIADAVAKARALGVERLIGLPVYPLCGPSTTVAALETLDREIQRQEWAVSTRQISGWHRHPAYIALRANAIRRVLEENRLAFDGKTKLVFSAHGTPIKYLDEGSRYDLYVRDFCAAVTRELGVDDYVIGYQNHTNRPGVQWTQPDVEKVIAEIDAERVVVDPVSFMHEQSETLAELDHELREEAEERGLEFYRVPIGYAAPEFIGVLADLVEPFASEPETARAGDAEVAGVPLLQCLCKPTRGTCCLNAAIHRAPV
jgi:ferrochelatase